MKSKTAEGCDNMTLGAIVKRYRDEHGISQRQFAATCGLSNGFISMLEKNKNPKTGLPMAPSLLVVKKIAQSMNTSFHALIQQADDIKQMIEGGVITHGAINRVEVV
jgi:transcriptional regulator with XRE-family HTH domain